MLFPKKHKRNYHHVAGHCHLFWKGPKWLTRRHRQKDLALELLTKLMQGLFLSSTRENKGISACWKRAFTMEWGAYLAKPERIKKNALFRKNGSALLHGDIFFYAFWEKAYCCGFHECWLETPLTGGERVYSCYPVSQKLNRQFH